MYRIEVIIINIDFLNKKLTGYYRFRKISKVHHKTIYLEIKHIESFLKFLNDIEKYDLTSIDSYIFEKFISYCKNNKNKNKTINAKLTSLNHFFNYLVKYEHLYKYNPLIHVKKLDNEPESIQKIISQKHLKLILDTYDTLPYGIRDKCIALIVLETALSLSIVINLKLNCFSKDFTYFNIDIDSEKKRFFISSSLSNLLKKYLMFRITNLLVNRSSEFLFISRRRNSYTIRNFQLQFKEVLIYANISNLYTPRTLRATAIYNLSKQLGKTNLSNMINQTRIPNCYEIDN